MKLIGRNCALGTLGTALLSLGVLLAACAGGPPAASTVPVVQGSAATQTATGRLMLEIVDQNGSPLGAATVDMRSVGAGSRFYRVTGTTNSLGRLTFNNVPPRVEINVNVTNGTASQVATVPQQGSSDVRIYVTTYGDVPQDTTGPNDAGAISGRAPGR
jgi:hypothetical protein